MSGRFDSLDYGRPGERAWEEFRATFSAAYQHLWLLDELKSIAPDYAESLEARFQMGFATADYLADEDPDYDGQVPVTDPEELGHSWFDADSAALIYDQLFPHGRGDRDKISRGYGMTLVGIHAALECYATAVGVPHYGPLPKRIKTFVLERTKVDFDATTADLLENCDATRHIIAHNRGVVDEPFVNRIKDNRFVIGEYRRLTSGLVHDFAQAVWRTAVRVREAAATQSPSR